MNFARKTLTAVAASVGTVAVASIAFAAPAFASVSGDYAANGVYIRSGPGTSYTAKGLGYPGQGATISCFTSGTNVNGNPYWDYNRNNHTGVTGYSADYYMSWYGVLYHC